MNDLIRYNAVNQTESLKELANVIRSFADEDGMIQGRKRKFNAERMAAICEGAVDVHIDEFKFNLLTRNWGIRQQAMMLDQYDLI